MLEPNHQMEETLDRGHLEQLIRAAECELRLIPKMAGECSSRDGCIDVRVRTRALGNALTAPPLQPACCVCVCRVEAVGDPRRPRDRSGEAGGGSGRPRLGAAASASGVDGRHRHRPAR